MRGGDPAGRPALPLRFVLVGPYDIFGDRDLVAWQPLLIKRPLGVRVALTLRGSVHGALVQVGITNVQIDLMALTHAGLLTHVPSKVTVMPER